MWDVELDEELPGEIMSEVWGMCVTNERVDVSIEVFNFVEVFPQRKWPIIFYYKLTLTQCI
jgi:hypothetical protein